MQKKSSVDKRKAKSYSANVGTVCYVCKMPYVCAVWMIIDFQECPDLWNKCRDGSIYDVTCPHGHTGELDFPILLHDGIRRRVIFVPSKSSSDEEDEDAANDLVQKLIVDFPDSEESAYLFRVEVIYQQHIRGFLETKERA